MWGKVEKVSGQACEAIQTWNLCWGLPLAAGFHCAAGLLLGIVADLGQMSINVRGCDFFFFSPFKVKGTDLESSQQILSMLFNIV